jgi:hypothetical protein
MFRILARQLRDRWNTSTKAKRRSHLGSRFRRPRLEPLEDRTLLSINYENLGTQLGIVANKITNNLVPYFTRDDFIPFIGHRLQDFSFLYNKLQGIKNALEPLGTRDSATVEADIRERLGSLVHGGRNP